MVAYMRGHMRGVTWTPVNRFADHCDGGGNAQNAEKKMLNSGNELKDLLQTKDLAVSGAKNELVFEPKTSQSEPIKRPKTYLLCGLERNWG
jgi:hypothetical protein